MADRDSMMADFYRLSPADDWPRGKAHADGRPRIVMPASRRASDPRMLA